MIVWSDDCPGQPCREELITLREAVKQIAADVWTGLQEPQFWGMVFIVVALIVGTEVCR